MKFKNILLIAALASIPLVNPATLAQNQICPQLAVVPPSRQTKIIRQEKFGYSFKMPNNYKTMSSSTSSGLLIFDPNTFTLTQCLIKNQAAREYPEHISIYAKAVNPKNRDLAYLVRQEIPLIEKFENTKVANQNAITYTANVLGYEKKVSFFTPDRKYIITISAPFNLKQGRPTTIFNKAVFDQVLSGFTFIRR